MTKKILHILNSSSFSGAENVVVTIINNSDVQEKHYYASLDGSIREVLNEFNIEFIPLKKLTVYELKNILKLVDPDVIHAHDFTASIVSALTLTKTPIISHIHNNVPWLKKIGFNSLAYLFSSIKYYKILGVSPSIINEYIFSSLIKKKFVNIENPIDKSSIIYKASKKSENTNEYDLIFIGRLCEQKNPLAFIESVYKLKKYVPNISVAIIGEGDLKNECINLIEKNDLEENIHLLGFLKNPYPIIKKSKVLCMTSRWEGYGLVAAEALSLGKPVVATIVGGLPTIVNEECGFLTNSNDEYIKEIKKLLENENYYSKKETGAMLRSDEINNIKMYMKKISSTYNEVFYS